MVKQHSKRPATAAVDHVALGWMDFGARQTAQAPTAVQVYNDRGPSGLSAPRWRSKRQPPADARQPRGSFGDGPAAPMDRGPGGLGAGAKGHMQNQQRGSRQGDAVAMGGEGEEMALAEQDAGECSAPAPSG